MIISPSAVLALHASKGKRLAYMSSWSPFSLDGSGYRSE
jgi:hypothetical protein